MTDTLQSIGTYLISPWFMLALYQAVLCLVFTVLWNITLEKDWSESVCLAIVITWAMLMGQAVLWVLL